MVEKVISLLGGIDILVLCTGLDMQARFADIEENSLKTVMDQMHSANFESYVFCTYFALKHLRDTCGQIVVVSSFAGEFPRFLFLLLLFCFFWK